MKFQVVAALVEMELKKFIRQPTNLFLNRAQTSKNGEFLTIT